MNENKRYIALSASAGSGKTFALSVRFVALVLEKENGVYKDIKNILAITFTNKAANEMKERVIDAFLNLNSYKNNAKTAEQMRQICDLLGGISADEVLKRHDERLKDFLNTELRIYTFDAFFGSILRQFSLNAGLLPDFSIDQSQGAFINENYIKSLGKNGIKELASYIYKSNFSSGRQFLESLNKFHNCDFNVKIPPKPDETKLWQSFDELNKAAQSSKNFSAFSKINSLNDMKKFLQKGSGFVNLMKELEKNYTLPLENFIKSFDEYYKSLVPYKISTFFAFAKKYLKSRNEIIKKRNKLDFSDVSSMVYSLLKNGEPKIMVNDLYFRLDGKITDILIDEFQDTNAEQFEILYPLIEEIMSGKGAHEGLGSFFYVGDVKQSIYAFRGGQKEIFSHLQKQCFDGRIKPENLTHNRRSDRLIVDFVNATFKDKIDEYIPQQIASKDDGYVEVASFDSADELAFADLLCQKITLLKDNGVSDNYITILCWKNEDIKKCKDILQSKGFEVASRAKNLKEAKDAELVLEYLKFCLFDDQNSKAYLELFNYTIEKKSLKINQPEITIRNLARELGLNEFSANLLILCEIASTKCNIFEFIYDIENDQTKACELVSNGINIMTVHSSKGLDLPHVIVCDGFGKGNKDTDVFLSYYDLEKSRWEITLNDNILEYLRNQDYINIKNKLDKIAQDEQINKLYVALTRAKHSLIILGKTGGNGNSPSYFKSYTKGSNKDKIEICMLDLPDFCQGEISPSKNEQSGFKARKLEPFESVARQNVNLKANEEMKAIKLDNLKNIYFGKAMHYAFEMSGDFSPKSIEIGTEASLNKYGYLLDSSSFESIKSRIYSFAKLKNERFASLKNMLKEQEIIYNKELLRLDLLLFDDENFVIIDYKSSLNAASNSKEKLNLYKKAISEIYNKNVSAYFAVFEGNECRLLET